MQREHFDPGPNLGRLEPVPVRLPDQLAADDGGDLPASRGAPEQCGPALIVGVGNEGLALLALLKANLVSRFGRVPDQLKLLWLDFEAPDRRPAQYPPNLPVAHQLGEEQRLVLKVEKPEDGEYHCKAVGFEASDWQRPGRARARAILHHDWGTDGSNSRLRMTLAQLVDRSQELDAYVAIPAGDEASGMAADLPRLIATVLGARLAHQTLLLLDASTRSGAGAQEEQLEAATLLELARLGLRGRRWWSLYGPVTDAVTDSQVIVANVVHQAIAALPELRGQVRLPSNDPRTSAVGRVADLLTCVLTGPFQSYRARRARAAQGRSERQAASHRYLVAAVGCEYWRLPVNEVRDLYRARLLDAFSAEGGILGSHPAQAVELDRYLTAGGYASRSILGIALNKEEARRVAGDRYVFARGAIQRLVEHGGNVFEVALEDALNQLFAAEQTPCGALGRASALLDQVSERLKETRGILLRARARPPDWRGSPVPYAQLPKSELEPLEGWYRQALEVVERARQSINAWQGTRQRLWAQVQNERRDAEGRWGWLREMPGVRRAIGRADIPAIDAALRNVDAHGMMQRWRWTWQQGRPILCGYSLDPCAGGGQEPPRAQVQQFTAEDTDSLWRLAQEHARFYSREVLDWPCWAISRCWQGQEGDAARALVHEASPLSDFDRRVIDNLGISEDVSWFLWVPDGVDATELAGRITDASHLEAGTWQDPYAVALLSYVECIPVESLGVWKSARDVPPAVLLFRPEQTMRRIEDELAGLFRLAEQEVLVWEGYRPEQMLPTCWGNPWDPNQEVYEPILHPEFRALLEPEDRARLFAEAFLLGLVVEENGEWLLRFDGVEVALAGHPLDALDRFIWAPEGFGGGPFQDKAAVERTLRALRQTLDRTEPTPDSEVLKRLTDVQQRAELDTSGGHRLLWASFRNWLYLCALWRVRERRARQ